MGGASWARLGADGAWRPWLTERNVVTVDFKPSNGGFVVNFSEFIQAHAGEPVKSIVASTVLPDSGKVIQKTGDLIITEQGVEGGVIYALSRYLREAILQTGQAQLSLDLMPHRSPEQLRELLSKSIGKQTLASFWRRQIGLDGIKAALVREFLPRPSWIDSSAVAHAIKNLTISIDGMRPIDEAISTAGGVSRLAVEHDLMLKQWCGVFCAGEMLDWDAPTGGYLLTACLASGYWAGQGVNEWLPHHAHDTAV